MKKSKIKYLILFLVMAMFMSLLIPMDAFAAKKKKLTADEIAQITSTINNLTKKVYASGLFSPKDYNSLIDVKLKLDTAMMGTPNPDFAPLYFKLGYIYNKREHRDDAIECYQTVLDNFAGTPYSMKAMNELKKMGVKIVAPSSGENAE